jgi:GMP synthase (glutamine-hydrolysing)
MQPHPEFDSEVIEGLIEHRGKGKLDPNMLMSAANRLNKPTSSAPMADMIAAALTKQASTS